MNRIIFPLRLRMQGEAVADLQDGLRLLLDKGVFPLSDAEQQAFEQRLRVERAESTVGWGECNEPQQWMSRRNAAWLYTIGLATGTWLQRLDEPW